MQFFKNKLQILVSILYILFVGWWVSFQGVLSAQGSSIQWFGATYGVMALIGAIVGFIAAQRFGGFKSVVGRAIMFISLALLLQEAGQLIYSYYIYGAGIEIPYPSWGDAAYFGSALSFIFGAYFLAKSVGLGAYFKKSHSKLIPIIVPLVIFGVSSFIFLYGHKYDTSQPLTVFLDFGYPVTEAAYISLVLVAYLSSAKLLGGMMKSALLILMIGMAFEYASDFTFLYESSRGTWIAGGIADLLYLTAYAVMTTSMVKLLDTFSKMKQKTAVKEKES